MNTGSAKHMDNKRVIITVREKRFHTSLCEAVAVPKYKTDVRVTATRIKKDNTSMCVGVQETIRRIWCLIRVIQAKIQTLAVAVFTNKSMYMYCGVAEGMNNETIIILMQYNNVYEATIGRNLIPLKTSLINRNCAIEKNVYAILNK